MNTCQPATDTPTEQLHWYATKVFYNRVQPLIAECKETGIEFFAPVQVISSLLFLRCKEHYISKFMENHWRETSIYRNLAGNTPAVIRDKEMEVFKFVVTSGQQGLILLGDDKPEYHQGDRVVVTQGPFKGAEGHIKRIRRDRRLVISIPGVVAVATAYIHPDFLQKVETT